MFVSRQFVQILNNRCFVRHTVFGVRKSTAELRYSSVSRSYETIITETKGLKQNVSLITLNRPHVLNALNSQITSELTEVLVKCDEDNSIGTIVITGKGKAFSAGADLTEVLNLTSVSASETILFKKLADVLKCKKPIIAAVNGLAFGGGAELSMMCDIVYASEEASFSLPEVKMGLVPGLGGTQFVARSAGKAKAMEMVLIGDPITAQDAERIGIINKVLPASILVDEAIRTAEKIASYPQNVVKMCKESVKSAFETSLEEGLKFERKTSYESMSMNGKEGLRAFTEKRKPKFTNS